jgi:hypothetical protein
MTLFVSYSRRDVEPVMAFVDDLDGAGHDVFLDKDLHGGEEWWATILRKIRECEVFIVALSQNVLESEPCRLEIGYARALKLPILPVQIGEVDTYRLDPIFTKQLIDYRNPTAKIAYALTNALRDCAAQHQPLPEPLPDPPSIPYAYLIDLSETIRGAADIPHQEQSYVLLRLRQAWRDESDESVRQDIRNLLLVMRRRPDITFMVGEDIDRALVEGPGKPQVPGPAHEPSRPANWYPDPWRKATYRYWDGSKWTIHESNGGTQPQAPPSNAPANAGGPGQPTGDPPPQEPNTVRPRSGLVTDRPQAVVPSAGRAPDNNLVLAIITTVLCCIPVGIAAIVYASRVNPLWAQGRHDEARQAAANAQKLMVWTVVAGVAYYGVMFLLYATGAIK